MLVQRTLTVGDELGDESEELGAGLDGAFLKHRLTERVAPLLCRQRRGELTVKVDTKNTSQEVDPPLVFLSWLHVEGWTSVTRLAVSNSSKRDLPPQRT